MVLGLLNYDILGQNGEGPNSVFKGNRPYLLFFSTKGKLKLFTLSHKKILELKKLI